VHLNQLQLTNFKNYYTAKFSFSPQLNFITGNNGAGKTTVLDAIHYLCLGKSYFHNSDANSIVHGEKFFRVSGDFGKEEKINITSVYQLGGKKELTKNEVMYPRMIDHVGLLAVVMITPDDQLLIDEGSEERRKFIDNTISQIDHSYLEILVAYNKVLQQRNAALKKFGETRTVDHHLLDSYNAQLAASGKAIFNFRERHFKNMIPLLEKKYEMLADNIEKVTASYNSVCRTEDLAAALKKSTAKDIATQRTNEGIHKDDFDFFLNHKSLKKFGSQGQKKSFLMAIKFAQFEIISIEKNQKPILLLDDLFDKLDKKRSQNILEVISENGFGQVFITDTNEKRIEKFISGSKKTVVHYFIENNVAIAIQQQS
jgi:DNA replication and repair protein RecF